MMLSRASRVVVALSALLLLLVAASHSASLPSKQRTCGPGGNVKVVETELPSNVGQVDDYQLHFVTGNNAMILMRTMDSRVFLSRDEGVSWQEESVEARMPGVTELGVARIYALEYKDGRVLIVLMASTGRLWLYTGAATPYKSVAAPPRATHLYLHPHSYGVILARATVSSVTHELHLSQDAGETWQRIVGDIPWHGNVGWSTFPDTSDKRIYVQRYSTPDAPHAYKSVVVYSDDYFETSSPVVGKGAAPSLIQDFQHVLYWWAVGKGKMLVQTCAEEKCDAKRLHISENAGVTFHTAEFPDGPTASIDETAFGVHEHTDTAIWVSADRREGGTVRYSDLFHSTSPDRKFTLALPYLSGWDFTKYHGAEGIYIANQYITTHGVPPSREAEVHTLITFNKGSTWEPLQPPTRDAAGQPIACFAADGCSLHLQGYRSDSIFTWFYSIPTAPGVMIANGNVGRARVASLERAATYYSRDGGVTWREVVKGAHVPEVGDHGALVALVQDRAPTTRVTYTVNDGDTWDTCEFTDAAITARNMRVSQGWDSKRLVLYGRRRAENGDATTVLVHLNFDGAYSGQCTAAQFEKWEPHALKSHCILGEQTTITRRAPGHNCFLPEDYQVESVSRPCPCEDADYECMHCFSRPSLSEPCTLDCMVPNLPPEDPKQCAGHSPASPKFYEARFGYQLVDDDKCDATAASAKLPAARIPCGLARGPVAPPAASGTQVGLIVALVIVIVVLVAVGGVWYLWKYNDAFYNAVSYTLGIDDGRGVDVYTGSDDTGGTSLLDTGGTLGLINLDESDSQ